MLRAARNLSRQFNILYFKHNYQCILLLVKATTTKELMRKAKYQTHECTQKALLELKSRGHLGWAFVDLHRLSWHYVCVRVCYKCSDSKVPGPGNKNNNIRPQCCWED